MGIGMALLEETVSDRTGRLVTTSLADYVVLSTRTCAMSTCCSLDNQIR